MAITLNTSIQHISLEWGKKCVDSEFLIIYGIFHWNNEIWVNFRYNRTYMKILSMSRCTKFQNSKYISFWLTTNPTSPFHSLYISVYRMLDSFFTNVLFEKICYKTVYSLKKRRSTATQMQNRKSLTLQISKKRIWINVSDPKTKVQK